MIADRAHDRAVVGIGNQPFMSIQAVGKTYRGKERSVKALDPVNLDLAAGEFVSVVGPSGCGKSTLIMLVAGLVPMTTGQVVIEGRRVMSPYTNVGIIFQRDALLDWRTVLDNVLLQIDIRRLPRSRYEPLARELLTRVGLGGFETYHPWELSGGMRQRVALCRALIHDPSLLLMDEPFGALDALTRDQMILDLERIWLENRKTIMFITHSISEAIFLSDRIVVMSPRPGRIASEIRVSLPRPRRLSVRESTAFGRYAAQIREQFQAFGLLTEA
jgi:NitT/TauT family transport system ATP-binding protein